MDRLVTNRGRKLLNKGKIMKGERDGVGQEINLSHRWKANCNWYGTNMHVIPGNWLAVGGSSGFFFFFSANGREVKGKMRKRETDIYILLDKMLWCPLKLMLRLSGGWMRHTKTCKEKNGEGRKKGRLKDKKGEKSEIWVKREERGEVEGSLTG